VIAPATAAHSRAKPQIGRPKTRPKTAMPVEYGAGSARWATPPSRLAAVIDWPSGPSTIHSVGTMFAGPTFCWVSRHHTRVITTKEAIRLSPNIA
jgi:hypothetical protein